MISAAGAVSTSNTGNGFEAANASVVLATNATAARNVAGFHASQNGTLHADGSTARANTTGYQALLQGVIVALATSANNSSTTTYSPTPSGTMNSTNGGLITYR